MIHSIHAIDVSQELFPGVPAKKVTTFGCVAVFEDELSVRGAVQVAAATNDFLLTLRYADGRLTAESSHLQGPYDMHERDVGWEVLRWGADPIIIEGSAFADLRLDHLVAAGVMSGHRIILAGTVQEVASPVGQRLVGVMEAIRKMDEEGVWIGDGYLDKLREQAKEAIPVAPEMGV